MAFVSPFQSPFVKPFPFEGAAAWNYTDIAGCLGLWRFVDAANLFTDTARTTPVTSDGDVVKGVTDLSGAGNHLFQATTSLAMLYKVNIVNGYPVVRGDATDDCFEFTTNIPTTPSTVFLAVVKRSSPAAYLRTSTGGTNMAGLISFGDSGGLTPYLWHNSGANNLLISASESSSALNSPRIITMRAAASNDASLRINGTQIGTDTSYSGLTAVYDRLGLWGGASAYGSKDYLMMVAYNSKLSDGDCAIVEAAIAAEYA